jgi:hypothetical protein
MALTASLTRGLYGSNLESQYKLLAPLYTERQG